MFEIVARPGSVLAMIDSEGDRREHEVVIDPGGLGMPRTLELIDVGST